ncbi:CBS domain-containing protein [Pseudomaricurvus alcaniphilus]|uniref:nucleotidyltransferase family protein n=1 Tax=Pseudomaricurvus alcaniphilus TaxID=1166482 RepID=UPI001408E059|nr:nucleotidyltransferase family protein [Pseudomaricurvus alcaniphilus]NHN39439.1 CBS domain-containing protein [Pseudomaricurvus alcaniphilus]
MAFNWQNAVIDSGCSIIDALKVIDREATQAAFVVDDQRRLKGLVTDGDIRRGLLADIGLTQPVSKVMNSTPLSCKEDDSSASILRLMEAKKIVHMPILDSFGTLINVLSMQDLIRKPRHDNPVLLMAGGFGSRLYPLTEKCPKPMLNVGKQPILQTILESFIDSGFHQFYISTHYLSDVIREHFGDGSKWDVSIRYIHEAEPLGTAGALGLLPGDLPDLPMIIMNGDILTKIDFSRLLAYHQESNADATLCVRQHEYQVPYGVVQSNDFKISNIEEKPVSRFYINAGIYVLNAELVGGVKKDEHCDMPTLLNRKAEQGGNVFMYPLDEYWLDVGRINDFEQAQQDVLNLFR